MAEKIILICMLVSLGLHLYFLIFLVVDDIRCDTSFQRFLSGLKKQYRADKKRPGDAADV